MSHPTQSVNMFSRLWSLCAPKSKRVCVGVGGVGVGGARKYSKNAASVSRKSKPRILLTGSNGQIGSELVTLLQGEYGYDSVVASDIRKPYELKSIFRYIDVTSVQSIDTVVVEEKIDWIIHLSSILSATGEANIDRAITLNIRGIENILQVARNHSLRVYAPSSIAAFGPSTPLDNTPDLVPMRPTTIYGVSKVYLELLGEYYNYRFEIDFRSLRYPGVISSETSPGGGTTDYAVDIFRQALTKEKYTCYLESDVRLPMMYMPDCLKGTLQFIKADNSKLTQRTYNLAAFSFTPEELATEIKKFIPNFQITYAPDFRNSIAKNWPTSLDDSKARNDWGWQNEYTIETMTKDMLEKVEKQLSNE